MNFTLFIDFLIVFFEIIVCIGLLVILFYYLKCKIIKYCITKYEKKNDCQLVVVADASYGLINKYVIKYFLNNFIINIDDDATFVNQMESIFEFKNLHIILHTFGGSVYSSDIIIQEILNYRKIGFCKIFVPQFAYSAGTLIALSGDELVMNCWALLSPTDPQYVLDDEIYSLNIMNDLLKSEKIEISEKTYLNALDMRKLHKDNINILNKLLKKNKINNQHRKKIIDELASGKHPHHKPFDVDILRSFGLKINTNMPLEIKKIFNSVFCFL